MLVTQVHGISTAGNTALEVARQANELSGPSLDPDVFPDQLLDTYNKSGNRTEDYLRWNTIATVVVEVEAVPIA